MHLQAKASSSLFLLYAKDITIAPMSALVNQRGTAWQNCHF